jgi:broad specificity phosphatase PhoE
MNFKVMEDIDKTPHFGFEVYLIRHGETKWSKSGQHTGITDIPLTSGGEEQASCIKKRLDGKIFEKVLVSPLERAIRTCEIAGYREQAIITEDLYEWDYGEYEGITTKEIRKTNPGWTVFNGDIPKGETLDQVSLRADRVIAELAKTQGNIALFSSGHILRILGARWIGLDPSHACHLILSTASLCILGYEHESRTIKLWNDTSHFS